jgi:hypothetical protein
MSGVAPSQGSTPAGHDRAAEPEHLCGSLRCRRNLLAPNVAVVSDAQVGARTYFSARSKPPCTTCMSSWCSSPSIEVVYSRQKCSTGANKPSPECARISTRPWPSSKEPRPCSPARAVPTEGGALPPARLPQRCLIQSVAARLRRHDHQPSPGWQVLVTVTLRQITRRPASGHSPGIHRQPETTRLARSSCPTQRTGLAP